MKDDMKKIIWKLIGKGDKKIKGEAELDVSIVEEGRMAMALKNNKLLGSILERMKKDFIMMWENSSYEQIREREICYLSMLIIKAIENKIASAIEMAEIELTKINKENNK